MKKVNNSEQARKKGLFIFFSFLLVLILTPLTYAETWSFQGDINHLAYSSLNSDYETFEGSLQGTANIDADSQPIIFDIDNAGNNEIIVYDDDTIYILDENAIIIRQSTLDSSILTPPSIYEYQGDDYIATITTTEVNLLDSTLSRVYNYTLSSSGVVRAVLSCVPEENCYVTYENDTNATHLTFNTTVKVETVGKLLNISSQKGLAIETVNNDKGYFICDDDENGNYGLCAVDYINRILDVAFSSDGIIDNIANNEQISPAVTYAFDGGTQEIGISYIDCTAGTDTNYHLHAYRSDGTTYNDRKIVLLNDRAGCSDYSLWSYPYINEVDPEFFCGIAEGQPASYVNEERGLFCFNVDTLSTYNVSFNPPGTQEAYNIISTDTDDDNLYAEVITYNGMFSYDFVEIYDMENSFSSGAYLSYGDVNGDGYGDVVGATATQVKVISNIDEITDAYSVTTDPTNNSIIKGIDDVRNATGLNLGYTAIWLIIMIFVSYILWTNGASGGVEGFGALALVNVFLLILGFYLGFIGIGIVVTILILSVAVIVFTVNKGMNGGG